MDTFNPASLSGAIVAPYDAAATEGSPMRDPILGLIVAAVVVAGIVAAVRHARGGRRLWIARAVLTGLVGVAALAVPEIGNRILSAAAYDAVPRWMSQVALWLLAFGVASALEWAVSIFRSGE